MLPPLASHVFHVARNEGVYGAKSGDPFFLIFVAQEEVVYKAIWVQLINGVGLEKDFLADFRGEGKYC
jgi:hypothetical protein